MDSANVVIGVRITKNRLLTPKTIRTCSCALPEGIDPQQHKYCPSCGTTLTHTKMQPAGEGCYNLKTERWVGTPAWYFDANRHTLHIPDGTKVKLIPRIHMRDPMEWFAGCSLHEGTRSSAKIDMPDLQELKDSLQKQLEPLGLYDEKEFGVWAIYQQP